LFCIEQPGQAVGGGLQLGLRDHPQQADPGTDLVGQDAEILGLFHARLAAGRVHRVQHADGPSHDRDRYADRRARAAGPVAQLRTGIQRFTVAEPLHLGTPGGRAAVR
jgi:hypothetical protein